MCNCVGISIDRSGRLYPQHSPPHTYAHANNPHVHRPCPPPAPHRAAPSPGSPAHGRAPVCFWFWFFLVGGGLGGVIWLVGCCRVVLFVGRQAGVSPPTPRPYHTPHLKKKKKTPPPKHTHTSNFVWLRPAIPQVRIDDAAPAPTPAAAAALFVEADGERAVRSVLAMYSQTNLLGDGWMHGWVGGWVDLVGCIG